MPRKQKNTKPLTLTGTLQKHRKGFGFLVFDDNSHEDAFVPPEIAGAFFDRDRLRIQATTRGEVLNIELLQHSVFEIFGKYEQPQHQGSKGCVIYTRKQFEERLALKSAPVDLKPGEWVQAKLEFTSDRAGTPHTEAVFVHRFGLEFPARADLDMIAAEFAIQRHHSTRSVSEAKQIGTRVRETDLKDRADFKHLPFITIDGETARDFDDAIFVEAADGGFTLWVAIADVAHYVRAGSAIDREAYERGTSFYFPETAFHMLPGELSENLCSLKPREPRLALVVKMHFDRTGLRGRTEICEAVIHSVRRATYNEIEREHKTHSHDKSWKFAPHYALYGLLRKKRTERGSIDFDMPEAEILCDADGDPSELRLTERLNSHRLIEEFMIAANEAVTEWMMRLKRPFVFRVHEQPNAEKLKSFQKLAARVGLKLRFDHDSITPKEVAKIVGFFDKHPASHLLNTSLLRSMKQARYSVTHDVHFGLASSGYTHFTSPIRRYPDLLVHRLIKAALRREKAAAVPGATTDHCNVRERLADQSEREMAKIKQARYMLRHLGEEFEGTITGMVERGLFIQIREPYVEGFLPISAFSDQAYNLDDEHSMFVGRRNKRKIKLGDSLRVTVVRANIERREVELRAE